MNVLLVLPDTGQTYTFNHGPAAVSATLKQKGHEVSLLHFTSTNHRRIMSKIKERKPDVVGFSLVENFYSIAKRLSKSIKRQLDIPVFWGGPFPSNYPQVIEEFDYIDGVCVGEGDFSFPDVLERIENNKSFYDVKGFWYRDGGEIYRNPIYPITPELNTLPYPDYSIFSKQAIRNYPAFSFSRGCPFKCTYCCAARKRNDDGEWETIRFKTPERAIDTIKDFQRQYDTPHFNFDDDTFFKSKSWVREFTSLYKQEIDKPFECNTRVETITDAMIGMLKDAGCQKLWLGIECGDEKLRKKVLGRPMKNAKILEAFDIVRKHGIATSSFNMMGFPGDTPEAHQRTIDLNRDIKPDHVQLTIFYPYRGTRLGDISYKENYVVNFNGFPSYVGRTILSLPGFTKRQIEREFKLFHFKIFWKYDYKKAIVYFFTTFLTKYPSLYRLCKMFFNKFLRQRMYTQTETTHSLSS
jgi:radical SAM superfamily enzyme YgiQ (UPF0313 family)